MLTVTFHKIYLFRGNEKNSSYHLLKERADAYCWHRSRRNRWVLWRASCQGWRGCHLPGTRDTIRGPSHTQSHSEVSPRRNVFASSPCDERSAGDRTSRLGAVLRQNV